MPADEPVFTILVVDDEPPISDMLALIARQEFPQARFISTRSTRETLDHLDQHAAGLPRLILLDIDLGEDVDGLDLLAELKARLGHQVPIIMLSGLADEPKVNQAYAQGAVAYTQKPEDKQGWERYVRMLRDYWHRSAHLPGSESAGTA